ncbi:hypothetical protein IAR50_000762 [Cryptococcus sp. DSM 104548]
MQHGFIGTGRVTPLPGLPVKLDYECGLIKTQSRSMAMFFRLPGVLLSDADVTLALNSQRRCGKATCRSKSDGTVIEGTGTAIKDETRAVWKRMKGEEGEEMRVRMEEVKEVMKQSVESGRGRRDMINLGQCLL